jgi:DNA repair exonuclease SbcCD nuclease subunit
MPLKIFHAADIHIGMKFNSYPESVRNSLAEARFEAVDRLVSMANNEKCNMFVVAGDLFNNINIPRKDIDRVVKSLDGFSGECVIVMAGNHDYDNGMIELWDRFKKIAGDKIIVVNEERPYELMNYGIDGVVYPAPCHSKHSSENNIGWIRERDLNKSGVFHIGIAHGSLEGISPDMDMSYFYMSKKELEEIPVDAWLLGHTHISYPENSVVRNHRIFNPGTPEPDGLDCRHGGCAWIIDIDDNKNINAREVTTGKYKFFDVEKEVREDEELDRIKGEILNGSPESKVFRLTLSGRINSDTYHNRQKYYNELGEKLACFIIDDSKLGMKITMNDIEKEFTKDSFPHRILAELSDDDDVLQIAYELIKGVK